MNPNRRTHFENQTERPARLAFPSLAFPRHTLALPLSSSNPSSLVLLVQMHTHQTRCDDPALRTHTPHVSPHQIRGRDKQVAQRPQHWRKEFRGVDAGKGRGGECPYERYQSGGR